MKCTNKLKNIEASSLVSAWKLAASGVILFLEQEKLCFSGHSCYCEGNGFEQLFLEFSCKGSKS